MQIRARFLAFYLAPTTFGCQNLRLAQAVVVMSVLTTRRVPKQVRLFSSGFLFLMLAAFLHVHDAAQEVRVDIEAKLVD